MMRAYAVTAAVLLLVVPALARAQDGQSVDRPLATRPELQAALQRAGASAEAARIKARLTEGDFRRGDRIGLMVQGEKELTDTFTVGPQIDLMLPPPTVGALSLKGVLRSELEGKLMEYVSRFRTNAVVRAQPLLRLSVQGEVAKAGVYAVAADGQIADALMAAGGTTNYAKASNITIERNGQKIWQGSSVQTDLDALQLQDGDQIVVDSKRPGGGDTLRITALIVSIAGGLYGLSRAIHH